MSKRVRTNTVLIPIKDWQEADDHIKRIGTVQDEIVKAEIEAGKKIDAIKAELAELKAAKENTIQLHADSLQAFAEQHKDEFGKLRSRKLNFGVLGWRFSSEISVTKATVEKIKEFFKTKASLYLNIKETPDKTALAKLTDEQLASVDARRKDKDVFFVEPAKCEAESYK